MALKPTKPTVPPAPSRSNPGATFSQTADTFAAFQSVFADYLDATAEFVDDRADAALAAALAGTLPALTGKAGRFLRVNPGETAVEFAQVSGIGSETAQTITNLNTHNIGGTFYAASGATGLPVAEASVVVHQPADTNARAVQEVVSLTSGRRFWRVESGGTWGAWVEVTQNNAGEVSFFARNTAPDGWLKANGAAVSRTTYAALFAAIGTTFGAGDGSTTFNLPDLRGEFLRGWDDGRGVDTGRAFGSAQSSQNLSHSHTGSTDSAGAHTHTALAFTTQNPSIANVGGSGNWPVSSNTSSAGAHTHTLTIGSEGGAEARPRNIALLACIKF